MRSETWTGEVRAEMARQRRTQRDLAEHLGVDESTVNRWMTGRSDWPLGAALDTSAWLGVAPSALLARAESAAAGSVA